jgi:hypothetical protein
MVIGVVTILVLLLIVFLSMYNYVETFQGMDRQIGTYYINVEKSLDRRNFMEEQFENYSIEATRINGVTPANLNQFQIIKTNCSSSMSTVEYACTLSHLKAIYTAYQLGDDYALILEDDVVFLRNPDIQAIINEAPTDWKLIQLYAIGPHANEMYKSDKIFDKYEIGYWSTAAYLINKNGINAILETFLPNFINNESWDKVVEINFSTAPSCVADILLYTIPGVYTCSDYFFHTRDIDSLLHESHLDLHR